MSEWNNEYQFTDMITLSNQKSTFNNKHTFTAELLVDRAMELRYIGGHYGGNVKPTPFLCLTLKMLQIQPDKDIIIEFIKNDHKLVDFNLRNKGLVYFYYICIIKMFSLSIRKTLL